MHTETTYYFLVDTGALVEHLLSLPFTGTAYVPWVVHGALTWELIMLITSFNMTCPYIK
jgi:hypothetical protein